jgi:hypothetical protein
MTRAPEHPHESEPAAQPTTPAGVPETGEPHRGEAVARLIAAAEEAAEMPLAAYAAMAELAAYLCGHDTGEAA